MSEHEGDLTETVRNLVPFAVHLGIGGVRGGKERIVAELPWTDGLASTAGTLHAGAIMGLGDLVGTFVAFLNLPEGATGTTTIESKSNFLRATRGATVTAVGKPLHVGRSTIVIDTTLHEGDTLLARVTQTQAVLWPR